MTVLINLDLQGEAPPEVFTSGFHTLKIGGGGYIPHLDIHPGNGSVASDGSAVICTDVAGFWHRNYGDADWVRLDCISSMIGGAGVTGDFGGNIGGSTGAAIAPSDSDIIYAMYSALNGEFLMNAVWKSVDRGETFTRTDLSWKSNSSGFGAYNNWMPNSNTIKFGTERIAIDPFNPDVVYCGTFARNTSGVDGMMRTFDGGDSWTLVTEIPSAYSNPGYCGLAFDVSEGSAVVGGQTRCRRLIVPCNGGGCWETNDGGVTWANKASNPSTTLTANYTTTVDNCVIMVNVNCPGQNFVTGVSAVKSAVTYNGVLRSWQSHPGELFNVFSYFIVAPTAGTYAITINFADGSCGSTWGSYPDNPPHDVAGIYAVAGCTTTNAGTIFDVAVPAWGSAMYAEARVPEITTLTANAMIVCHGMVKGATATSGYTAMNADAAKWIFQQYKIQATAGPYTAQPTGFADVSQLAYVVDAFKKNTTLSINGTPVVVMGSSYATITKPTHITCGQIDNSGNYFCMTKYQHGDNSGDGLWRYLKGGAFEKLDNTGLGNQPEMEHSGLRGGGVAVDRRPGYEGRILASTNSQPTQGFQAFNATAVDKADIVWHGQTGGHGFVQDSSDVPWLAGTFGTSGMCQIHPLTGDYWFVDGVAVYRADKDSLWGADDPTVHTVGMIAGIEELCAMDVCQPPGAAQPVLCSQDRFVVRAQSPNYPSTYPGGQTNGCQLDFAWNHPSYMVVMTNVGISGSPHLASWSGDFGETWTEFVNQPQASPTTPGGGLGGAIAALKYVSPTEAWVVACPGAYLAPRYTHDNGSNWYDCVGLPSDALYSVSIQSRWKPFAACRDDSNLCWAYAYGGTAPGVYRSDDGGVNWTRRSTLNVDGGVGPYVVNPPGYPDDLYVLGMYLDGGQVHYSSNARSSTITFTTISGFDFVYVFALAKQEDTGTYPSMMIYGKLTATGVVGYYVSKDKGATWTLKGIQGQLPRTNQFDATQSAQGSWEVPGLFFFPFNSSGCCLLAP